MTENILKTKSKVSDLNLQYMDVASKLVLLQNHQLLIQLEYQTQQIDELKEKNKSLEKKIYDLSREIDIHKKVELSLAEKNKTFNIKTERSKQKKFGAKRNTSSFIGPFLKPRKGKDNLLSQINFNIQKTNQNLNNPEEFYSNYFNSLLEGKINSNKKSTIFYSRHKTESAKPKDKEKGRSKINLHKDI